MEIEEAEAQQQQQPKSAEGVLQRAASMAVNLLSPKQASSSPKEPTRASARRPKSSGGSAAGAATKIPNAGGKGAAVGRKSSVAAPLKEMPLNSPKGQTQA